MADCPTGRDPKAAPPQQPQLPRGDGRWPWAGWLSRGFNPPSASSTEGTGETSERRPWLECFNPPSASSAEGTVLVLDPDRAHGVSTRPPPRRRREPLRRSRDEPRCLFQPALRLVGGGDYLRVSTEDQTEEFQPALRLVGGGDQGVESDAAGGCGFNPPQLRWVRRTEPTPVWRGIWRRRWSCR